MSRIPDQERALDLPLPDSYESPANTSLILVADDDSDIQQAMARYLSRSGYTTAFAADGKAALDLYKRLTTEGNQPALLIADLGLPEIDGCTLSLTIQQQFRTARILLTSGYKIDTNPTTGKTQEGFTFLQKPFEPNALLTTIERLLKQEDPQNSSSKRSSSHANYPRKHKKA
jgi:CheY-like chemotaxis protein